MNPALILMFVVIDQYSPSSMTFTIPGYPDIATCERAREPVASQFRLKLALRENSRKLETFCVDPHSDGSPK